MDPVFETKKRDNIAHTITYQINNIAHAALLGGSMAYGRDVTVTENSDIDLVIVCKPEKIAHFIQTPYFEGEANEEAIKLFEEDKITNFWVTKVVEGVEVNAFVYNYNQYIDACLLKQDVISYTKNKPSDFQKSYSFDGTLHEVPRDVKELDEGYTYTKKNFFEGKYISIPPSTDLTRGYIPLFQEDNIFDHLSSRVWSVMVKRLLEEYPNPDLEKTSILNSEWAYHNKPNFPKKHVKRIQTRTQFHIDQYKR